MRSLPEVSVVIPTYNRLSRLERVLQALSRQTYTGALEVVVVSDGSSDGTDDYLRSGRAPLPVVIGAQDNRGPAAARNLGVGLARGTLILFLDDDVVPLPELVEQHVRAHRRHGPGTVVLGPMLSPPDFEMTPWIRYEQAMLTKQYDAMAKGEWTPTPRQFYTGNASLARTHVVDAGGFDEAFRRAEDVELAYRLQEGGLRFVFVLEAVGHHYAERGYASWRENAYRYGRNDVIFSRDKGQDWLLWAMHGEFGEHHPLTRLVVGTCVNRPWISRCTLGLCAVIASVSSWLGADAVPRAALSAVYNATYYQGVADELGQPLSKARKTWTSEAGIAP